MTDIDRAVERDMRRKATTEPTETPMKGECAVCGKPVAAALPPRKDPDTPRFCDSHDQEDLMAKAEQEHLARQEERRERYFDRHGHF